MEKSLPNGLVLRTLSAGYASDRENLPHFYAEVNGAGRSAERQRGMIAHTNDLIDHHPTVTGDDIVLIVNPAAGDQIAAATVLIPQTWHYDGIPLAVGRPELVGTRPAYRRRGLVRLIFDAVHERSAELGHVLQVITGIPYFYRRFGYTMAVADEERALVALATVPDPADKPQFTLRPATDEDIPALLDWRDHIARQRLLSDWRSPQQLRYELHGYTSDDIQRLAFLVIENASGEGVGYVELFAIQRDPQLIDCMGYVVGEESSYLATFHDVLRGIKQWASAYYGNCPALLAFNAGLHETVEQLVSRMSGGFIRPRQYAWYLRVPDAVAFLRRIAPALEHRLNGSGAHRYTGELTVGFYDGNGVRLAFEDGRVSTIDAHVGMGKDDYDVSFPWQSFWNIVFGHQSYDELCDFLPDVWAGDQGGKVAVLLDALFPKKPSWLKGLM